MSTFALPDLGEGLVEAEIVSWHVAEGDHVVADEPLVSVETDKAVVEIPTPHAGRIAHLFGKVGDRIKVGAVLVEFDEQPYADAGAIAGVLPAALSTAAASPRPQGPASAPTPPRIDASPAIRALARKRGIDLAAIHGSGPGGIITSADVEAAVSPTATPPTGAGAKPLSGARRTMAIHMARSRAEVVPASLSDDADIQSWWRDDADVTTRLIEAVVAACSAAPILNAWFDGTALTLQRLPNVDLGIAVDTEDGLIVPVLRAANKKDRATIRRELDALKAAARVRTLPLTDLKGPTITLSNFGILAGKHATLAILPPQVAIIGAGRVFQRAVAGANGSTNFAYFLPLSLTFDHRAITGGDAARFMKAMIDALGQPN